MYHVHLAVQCIYGYSDEDGDEKEEREILGGLDRVEITWHLVSR